MDNDTTPPIPPALFRDVYQREFNAHRELATCEAWLAQYGPETERDEHRQRAGQATYEAARLATRILMMERT